MLTYLNDGFDGGATVFDVTGLSVAPRTGDAIVFATLDAAGPDDPPRRGSGDARQEISVFALDSQPPP